MGGGHPLIPFTTPAELKAWSGRGMPAPHHRRQTVFGKNLRRRSSATAASDTAALFSRYDRKLRDRVSAVVNTSRVNIEDACRVVWVQLLRYELDEVDVAYSWPSTVAIREAIKLDRADRRTRPLPVDERGAVIEPIDPRDELAARDLLDHAAAVIQQAGLTSRQLEDHLPPGVGTDRTSRSPLAPATAAAPSIARSCGRAPSSPRRCEPAALEKIAQSPTSECSEPSAPPAQRS